MAKTTTKKEKDPELELNAKWSGPEFWKDWGKDKKDKTKDSSNGGALYFVGFIGAIFYYMQAAENFGDVILGFLQSLVWPAIVVYKLLEGFYGLA
jgi:hypothetical protein